MGKKNPVEQYPLLYINKQTGNLWQVQKVTPGRFRIKANTRYITRDHLRNFFTFYGVIDRFGVIIKYRKEGNVWKRDSSVGAFDPKDRKWKSVRESEAEIILALNKMNKRNPELAYYDPNSESKRTLERASKEEELFWEGV